VVGDEDQLATANKLLESVLGGRDLKHGTRLTYLQLLEYDDVLNAQTRVANTKYADPLDLLAPAIEIDAAYFKGTIP
jgi:hypothetical protein